MMNFAVSFLERLGFKKSYNVNDKDCVDIEVENRKKRMILEMTEVVFQLQELQQSFKKNGLGDVKYVK